MNLNSYFVFTRQQRRGIFFLALFIVLFQCIYFFIDFYPPSTIAVDEEELINYQKQIDSIKKIKVATPKIFPFNPNYISDYKGYTLGMTTEELDRLFAFRAQGKFVNSAREFQEITKISDSTLNTITPYFKFPEWLNNKKTNQKKKTSLKKQILKKDLNTVTEEELQKVNGIGVKLSARIIKYRRFLGGFSNDDQLYEVYGLKEEVVKRVLSFFLVIKKPRIEKVNINTISLSELSKIPYVSYKEAKKIITYRSKFGRINSIKELYNIQDFSLDKIDRIELYLTID